MNDTARLRSPQSPLSVTRTPRGLAGLLPYWILTRVARAWVRSRRFVEHIPPEEREEAKRLSLFLAEYESLRQESAQAREAQQSIMQWSIGAFAAVLVAAFAVEVNVGSGPFSPRLIVFGLGLPILVFASALAWLGELYRMERAGHYLRCREKWFFRGTPPKFIHDAEVTEWMRFPLLWETVIHDAEHHKMDQSFRSGFAVYGAAVVFSCVIFLVEMLNQVGGAFVWTLGVAWVSLLVAGYAVYFLRRFSEMKREVGH